jgi:hypothetical protein
MSRVRGIIGHLGLDAWWESEFTPTERAYIQQTFQPLSNSPTALTQGEIISTSQTAVGLLSALLEWLKKPNKDEAIGLRIAGKLEGMVSQESDVITRHFAYQALIEWFYRFRECLPDTLSHASRACRRQIALSSVSAEAFRRAGTDTLPMHRGYEQLAIILQKQGKLDEAIEVATRALEEGWGGGWEARIKRLQGKKLKMSRAQLAADNE